MMPQSSLKKLSFVTLDLEATGSNEKRDQIIEIGMVKIKNLKIVGQLHFLIKPKINIPPFVQKLTTITPKDLTQAPAIEDVMEEILTFIGESIVVAHNISFDLPFLNSVLKRMDRPILTNPSLCTLTMSQHLIPHILSSNLKYMSSLFQLPPFKAHRALDDAKACALLLLHFLNLFKQKGLHQREQLFNLPREFDLTQRYFTAQEKKAFLTTATQTTLSALVQFRSEKNRVLACVPLKNPSQEGSILTHLADAVPYHICSIKLVSSFFAGCLEASTYEKKIKKSTHQTILTHLYQCHLQRSTPHQSSSATQVLDPKHFLVTNHLIPQQLCLYPLLNLPRSQSLTFRFPEHEKNSFNT